jgi:hypothetical protein
MDYSKIQIQGGVYNLFKIKDLTDIELEIAYKEVDQEIKNSWTTPKQNALRLLVMEIEDNIKLRGGKTTWNGNYVSFVDFSGEEE